MFKKLIANTLYIQVRKNAFRVRHIESKIERDFFAQQPFTTTRLLVGQFQFAEVLLRKAVSEIGKRSLFSVSPIVVIHPLEMVEDGLSEVESRLFQELAASAGARKVIVHVGVPLTDADVEIVSIGKNTR